MYKQKYLLYTLLFFKKGYNKTYPGRAEKIHLSIHNDEDK